MLTNLGHLDRLRTVITPPPCPGHHTYRLAEEPTVEVVWTYANRRPDGQYQPVGGGGHDPVTGYYTQGAFNADDNARAAVVYVRHWRATGDPASRDAARQLLRGLCYQQTVGDDQEDPAYGNVVLWQQHDGTLNRSGLPIDVPDPSDGNESAWLARSIWAFGEGYRAFHAEDPAFAAYLRRRLRIAVSAVRRQVLQRYGQCRALEDGAVPAWLIADGADMTGEALLGLSAYLEVTGDDEVAKVLEQLAEGVVAMRSGTPWTWPFGAVLPSAWTRSRWHAWAALAPAGLARAYAVTGDLAARDAALTDAASFTPYLLVDGGPDNLRAATPGARRPRTVDAVQLAYGAQSRLESLLATAEVTGRPALATLAGVAGSWFFGNNPAGAAMYDPATGCTFDGIDRPAPDVPGVVHRDAGAESTIHGLLAMLALDAHPHAAAVARVARRTETGGEQGTGGGTGGEVRSLRLTGPAGSAVTLLRSAATGPRTADVDVSGEGTGDVIVSVNEPDGAERERYVCGAGRIRVAVPPGGFTIVTRLAGGG